MKVRTLTDEITGNKKRGTMTCCDAPKTRGPNTSGEMTCPIHCSKCGHDRKYEDYLDFCFMCKKGDPCGGKL